MSTINAQSIINEAMAAHAIAPIKKDADFFSKVKIKTSDRGFHTILNCKENLQRFADLVRKNAAAFGGGLIREAKQKPAISWPANLISIFKQSIEDNDYQAALDIGDKLGALFFVDNKGAAQMQVAPVPCDFESRLSSVCNENGTYAVIFPQNMTSLSGASVKAKRSRQSQIDNVQTALNARTNFNLSEALDKQSFAPVDQATTRAKWILEHGLSAETIEARIVAHEVDSIEAMAAQDVAQVVAQAVTTIAISEAMQPSETDAELVTCEAGESEAEAMARRIDRLTREVETGKTNNGGVICGLRPSAIEKRITQLAELGVTVGSAPCATWAPVPQYVPCPPNKTGLGDGPAPAFRGNDGGTPTPPPAEFLGESTPPVVESTEYPDAAIEKRGITDFWVCGVDGWQVVGGGRNVPGYASESSAKIAISANKWKTRNAVILPFKYSDGGLIGCSPYAAVKTRFAVLVHSEVEIEPTPPAVESQPMAPVVVTPDTLESFDDTGDGVSDDLYEAVKNATVAQVQALTDAQFSKLYDHLENWNFHTENYMLEALRIGDESIIADMRQVVSDQNEAGYLRGDIYDRRIAITDRMRAKLESAKQAQDVPQTTHASDSHGWEPAIGERYIGAVEYAVQEANKRGDGFEYRTGEEALMERRKKNTVPTLRGEWLAATQGNRIESKSGKWTAWTFTTVMGAFGLGFMQWDNFVDLSDYMTAKDRMKALQGMARAVDDFTPPGGGLPCPEPVAVVEPVASVAPTPTVAVSSDTPAPRVAVRRNFIPDNGLHVVEDAFEAWTLTSGARFAFVMYLGKSEKPWKYYGYSTKAKRDDGFNRHAQEARSIALSKANRKAESKAQAEKPHGLQVGDVVRSSWGYDQTNVDHYQIVKVIGKRTVEVRKLVEHKESTGDMTGRLAPVYGEFVGEVMRRQVDSLGKVNILQASYGRASKIEPLAIVHGVRCYAASSYSSYA